MEDEEKKKSSENILQADIQSVSAAEVIPPDSSLTEHDSDLKEISLPKSNEIEEDEIVSKESIGFSDDTNNVTKEGTQNKDLLHSDVINPKKFENDVTEDGSDVEDIAQSKEAQKVKENDDKEDSVKKDTTVSSFQESVNKNIEDIVDIDEKADDKTEKKFEIANKNESSPEQFTEESSQENTMLKMLDADTPRSQEGTITALPQKDVELTKPEVPFQEDIRPAPNKTEEPNDLEETAEESDASTHPKKETLLEEKTKANEPTQNQEGSKIKSVENLDQMEVEEKKLEKVEIEEKFEEISYDLQDYQSLPQISDDSGIPQNILQFYHSFGYDCCKRSNLHLLQGPTALFAAGNYVHLLSLLTDEHHFLRTCGGGGVGALTVHPSGNYFAVAEKGIKPGIFIYNFPSLSLHRILKGGTEKAYSFVDFNPKGNLLASVGSAPDYMLTVWDWENEKIMLRSKAFSQEVYRVTFSPEQEGQLTSCGTTHIRFWKMAFTFTGLKLKGELGRFGKTALGDIEGYIQLPDGKVLSGSDWGNMLLWDGGLIKVEISRKNQKPCHVGSIQQLVMDEGELITIGRDGFVRVWEMEAIDSADTTDESDIFELEPMNELRVGTDVQLTCMVKAISEEKEEEDSVSVWYAQDANGGIWKLDLSFSHTTKPPQKLYSFTAGCITGLSCSPVSHLMATSGDAYVRVYDYLTKKTICHFKTSTPQVISSCVVWPDQVVDPKGTSVVAGFSDGIVRILTLQQIESVNKLTLQQAWKPHSAKVTVMSYDNSGELFATGSQDQTVFFFHVNSNQYDPIGFVKVPGQVTGLQWSPPGFPTSTLLVTCSNGNVVEIESPNQSANDTSHSYHLQNIKMKCFKFQSIKSELRRDEKREKKEKAKQDRREKRVKELKRRQEAGEEISPEDAQAFLEEDPETEKEEEEEPLYFPPEPNSVLQAFYIKPGVFVASMDGYDAGYLYECEFPEDGLLSNTDDLFVEPSRPVRSIPVRGDDDIAISSICFTKDRHKLIAGFKNGLIRVYPLKSNPEADFDLHMLGPYWEHNMHDNDSGTVTYLAESYDGAHLFSGGGDGNIFGYLSLAHEEIIKSMEGKRAKLPTPKKLISEQAAVDDIDDPHAYSIEDAKLKAEHDKMMREAEAKKFQERKRIEKLRKTFLELQNKNQELPLSVQLDKEEFELDPSLRHNMKLETTERIARVRLEMQWDKARLELAHHKLQDRFHSELLCDRMVVHSVASCHTVASYRLENLSKGFHTLHGSVSKTLGVGCVSSEKENNGLPDQASTNSNQTQTTKDQTDAEVMEESFIQEPEHKKKSTILHGRQAEKVQKALQKAAEARERRDLRQQEWIELYQSKPDDNYEDPADVAAIHEAQANMGDFKLKTASDYVVPEHLRMDTEKKRFQIFTLQELSHHYKLEFNKKLIKLRDDKLSLINEIQDHVEEIKKLQMKMPEQNRLPVPLVPKPHQEEEPHKKFEFTKELLLKFEVDENKRKVEAAQKKRTGDGGLFGGFGGEGGATTESASERKLGVRLSRKTNSVSSSATSKSSREKAPQQETTLFSALEAQLLRIEQIRCRYHRDRLLNLINSKISSFDAELRLLRHNKNKLDVDLKMADLREVTLIEELLLLKEYEKRENTLSGRVSAKRTEVAEMHGKAADMQVKLESKRRDIDRLTDREKALHASFVLSLGENNKFADFLNKVFKKKIKRAKKKVATEGDEDSDMTSSDESDFSSDEDDDDSMEGGFDDSVCPPGCDQQIFDSTIALREKRLDLEEALAEEKKIAETLKKDADSFAKKAKIIESQLKTALADLEAFQFYRDMTEIWDFLLRLPSRGKCHKCLSQVCNRVVQVEKQGKLNELDVVVPLRLHQVEHVYNGMVPNDLASCLVFTNQSLTTLQRRIKELQLEKSEQRKLYKEARQQHVHLIKNRRIMQQKINQLEEKCENMMMLKFGRVVDLEKLDVVTINKTVEELKEKIHRSEMRNSEEMTKRQRYISELRNQMRDLIRENTKRLDTLNVLLTDKDSLEQTLEKRQKNMELDDTTLRKKMEMREQHRLVQLVQLQAQEIQALKEEIGLLSRKGGHILPPAQPPLGQEQDVL